MICQNCKAEVEDDLIFCTNCGERLFETTNQAQTVLLNDSVVTKPSVKASPKPPSKLKWLALIVSLVAIPATLFGVYLLINSNNRQVSQNLSKPNTPISTPRKTNSNKNANADITDKNTNSTNA